MAYPRGGAGYYRSAFNGQEKDNELYGAEGTGLSFTHRMHDARVGRFLSIDPLASAYPWNSPFAFAENSVIRYGDLEGLERGDRPSFYGATGLVLAVDTEADAEGMIMRQLDALQKTPPPPDPWLQFLNRKPPTIGVPERERQANARAVEFAESTGFADGIRMGFGRDHNGEVSAGDRMWSAAMILPIGRLIPKPIKDAGGRVIKSLISLSEDGISAALKVPRLQHAFKHANDINAFKGKKWNNQVGAEWETFNRNVLENAEGTFENTLGGTKVNGFYKQVDGQHIGVQVFAEGDKAGQLATTVVLSEQQVKNFGLK